MTFQRLMPLLLVLSLGVSGCATFNTVRTVLYTIQNTDIVEMKKDTAYAPKSDGYFLSKFYMSEVLEARVEQKSK